MTDTFRARFSAEESGTAAAAQDGLYQRPLRPFRALLLPKQEIIEPLELRRAIHEQASGKAPGADGILMGLYKNLPAPQPELLELFNTIYESGAIPHML